LTLKNELSNTKYTSMDTATATITITSTTSNQTFRESHRGQGFNAQLAMA
jgi:hypothetical protein